MSSQTALAEDLRAQLLSAPEIVLNDIDLMRALIGATDRTKGANVIDLRGVAMDRLEERLDRLEATHRSVISAAYENLAGTNLIHRAVLKLLEPRDFATFLQAMAEEVPHSLRVEAVRLVLETTQSATETALGAYAGVVITAEPGFIGDYMALGQDNQPKSVVLRQVSPETEIIYGERRGWIRSEAAMKIDLGQGRLPGMLVLGSEDPHQFLPSHGIDLLLFFAGAFERAIRRWLD